MEEMRIESREKQYLETREENGMKALRDSTVWRRWEWNLRGTVYGGDENESKEGKDEGDENESLGYFMVEMKMKA